MTLNWFLFYWSHDVCWETGLYRIGNRAIQRALEWVAWSYCSREFKPLHPWHHIYWFLFLLYRCVALVLFLFIMTSSCPSRTRFACFRLLRFRCWRNVPVHIWQRVHTSSCVVFSLFLLLKIFTFCWVLIERHIGPKLDPWAPCRLPLWPSWKFIITCEFSTCLLRVAHRNMENRNWAHGLTIPPVALKWQFS